MSINTSFIQSYHLEDPVLTSPPKEVQMLGVVNDALAVYMDAKGILGVFSLEQKKRIYSWDPKIETPRAHLKILSTKLFYVDVYERDNFKFRKVIKSSKDQVHLNLNLTEKQKEEFRPVPGALDNAVLLIHKEYLAISREKKKEFIYFENEKYKLEEYSVSKEGTTLCFNPKKEGRSLCPNIKIFPEKIFNDLQESYLVFLPGLEAHSLTLKSAGIFDQKLFILCISLNTSIKIFWSPLSAFNKPCIQIENFDSYFNIQVIPDSPLIESIQITDFQKRRFTFLINNQFLGISSGHFDALKLEVLKQDTLFVEMTEFCYLVFKTDPKGRGNAFLTIPYSRDPQDRRQISAMIIPHSFECCVWSSESTFILQTPSSPKNYLLVIPSKKQSAWVKLAAFSALEESLVIDSNQLFYLEKGYVREVWLQQHKIGIMEASFPPIITLEFLNRATFPIQNAFQGSISSSSIQDVPLDLLNLFDPENKERLLIEESEC